MHFGVYIFAVNALIHFYICIFKDIENENNQSLEQVPIDDILEMQREEQIVKQQEEEKKKKAMLERGLQPHYEMHDDMF